MSGIEEMKKRTKLSIDEMYDTPLDENIGHKPKSKKSSSNSISDIHDTPYTPSNLEPIIPPSNEKFDFPVLNKQTPIVPTIKMTFVIPANLAKAFQDLYAKRIIEGRGTNKSDLIAEAIHWLLKMESNPR